MSLKEKIINFYLDKQVASKYTDGELLILFKITAWLKDVHGIHLEVYYDFTGEGGYFPYIINLSGSGKVLKTGYPNNTRTIKQDYFDALTVGVDYIINTLENERKNN